MCSVKSSLHVGEIVPKKIIWLFRVSIPTIIVLPTLTHFIRILGHALLVKKCSPFNECKMFLRNKMKMPTYLPYFSRKCNPKQTYYFCGLSFYTQIHTLFSSCSIFFHTMRGFLLHLCVKVEWKYHSTLHFFLMLGFPFSFYYL